MKKNKKKLVAKVKFERIDDKYMMLHTQIASGQFGDENYRFIQDVGNKGFVLQYRGKKYLVKTFDFVKGLLEIIE